MPKPKLTDEQKRVKNVKYARWAVIAWPIGFSLYVGLLCLCFLKRFEPSSPFNVYDTIQMSMGLLLPAYGYADAKYTLRTNGKELGPGGYAVALLLFNGVPFIRDVQKHGFPYLSPWALRVWLLLVVPMTLYVAFRLWRIRAARSQSS